MKSKIAKNLLICLSLSFVVGLILIFLSTSIGEIFGQKAIEANDGVIDTSDYQRIITSNTENFRTVGFVISLISGMGSLLSGYALYNEIEKDSVN